MPNNKPQKNKRLIIGLAGGIGAGKTAVTDILSGLNAHIIDADIISKRVTAEGSQCHAKIKDAFQDCVIGGVLNRDLLKKQVFENQQKRLLLNSLTHPFILEEVLAAVKKEGLNIIAVPLLFESGFNRLCDLTVCVTAPLEDRLARIIKRDKISADLAQKIVDSQIPQDELKKRCNYIIENSGDLSALKKRVNEWHKEILELLR